jgi:N-carbamoylputrescine amidase
MAGPRRQTSIRRHDGDRGGLLRATDPGQQPVVGGGGEDHVGHGRIPSLRRRSRSIEDDPDLGAARVEAADSGKQLLPRSLAPPVGPLAPAQDAHVEGVESIDQPDAGRALGGVAGHAPSVDGGLGCAGRRRSGPTLAPLEWGAREDGAGDAACDEERDDREGPGCAREEARHGYILSSRRDIPGHDWPGGGPIDWPGGGPIGRAVPRGYTRAVDEQASSREAIRIGLVQLRCGEDRTENLARALAGVEEAVGRGAAIVCLPELFRSPYPCQLEDVARFEWAEPIPGPSTEALAKRAQALGVAIVASVFERRAPGIYHNTAVTLDGTGAIAGVYRKMHIPDDPLYYEKFYFTPGDLGFGAVEVGGLRIGMLVCWDQWFPEAARLVALSGAQIVFYPTAIGWQLEEGREIERAQHDAWETVQRGHAIANGVFVAAVNRVGAEDAIRFWGQSFVADPFGRMLARASAAEPEVLVVECDLGRVEGVRRDWPFLRDRRVDAYGDLLRRYRD